MVADARATDLRRDALPWRSMTIPESTPDVELTRLHADRCTSASVALVRFPPGWTRPGSGHYRCAEQFVVLGGAIEVSGTAYLEGEYAYLPARMVRNRSRSQGGCLALAYFSGRPDWSVDPPAAPSDEPPLHGRVCDFDQPTDAGGGSYGSGRVATGPVDVTTELLWPESGLWCLLAAGAEAPSLPGPVLVREWR
jgi:ChrR Cupin-like domain